MEKTTVYLPAELKKSLKRASRESGLSEAELIRAAIRAAVGGSRPRPRAGLFAAPPMAHRVDELFDGFGHR